MTPAHIYQRIPGFFSFRRLYDRAVAEAEPGSTLVEVGVFYGRSLAYLAVEAARADKGLRVVGVDAFGLPPGAVLPGAPPVPPEGLERAARRHLAPLRGLLELVRAPSQEAAQLFEPESLEFVFLDGGHEVPEVRADCAAWWPRVRPGGVLAGDDFSMPSVSHAVTVWADETGGGELRWSSAPEGWSHWHITKDPPCGTFSS